MTGHCKTKAKRKFLNTIFTQEYRLIILKLLYMYTRIEQISKCIPDGGNRLLTARKEQYRDVREDNKEPHGTRLDLKTKYELF